MKYRETKSLEIPKHVMQISTLNAIVYANMCFCYARINSDREVVTYSFIQ